MRTGRGGEIGIHRGLKIPREHSHAGSSPAPGTPARRRVKSTCAASEATFATEVWKPAAVVLAAAVGLTATPVVAAQPVLEVTGEVSCAECRITVDTVLTLGGSDGPGSHLIAGPVPLAAVDQSGHILLGMWTRPEIAVFDSSGEFIREIGGAGEGPGEYALITHLNVGPEFIHVFDGWRGRTLLDAHYGVVRTDRFGAEIKWAAVTESETVVFAGDVQSSESVGHRLHLLGADGELLSYGGGGSVYRGGSGREYAVAANDSVAWVIAGAPGRVEEWALRPEPVLSRIIQRSVEEFDRENNRGTLAWPNVSNIGARLDDDGVWILWWGPDLAWSRRTTDPEVAGQWDREALGQTMYDGVLDLIDPETGRTLARYRSDLPMPGFVYGSDMVMAYEETSAGVPYLHLLRPVVHGRR